MSSPNKAFRLLELYERLSKGEFLNKKDIAREYNLHTRSIQRDFEELETFFHEKYMFGSSATIEYDCEKDAHYLAQENREYLTCMEIMAILKVLLESRGFNATEMNDIVEKLIMQVTPADRKLIKDMILNEQACYVPLRHETPLIDIIWEVSDAIKQQRMIEFCYTRQDGKQSQRVVQPAAILFSEFYFYLIGSLENKPQDAPAVFRLDRCQDIKITTKKFRIEYTSRFKPGEFRKRVQFMYPGELITVKFAFWGSSLEAILDRLPTARVVGKDGDKSIIEAEVFGKGIKMWLLSQMEFLEVLKPVELREEMQDTIRSLHSIYNI